MGGYDDEPSSYFQILTRNRKFSFFVFAALRLLERTVNLKMEATGLSLDIRIPFLFECRDGFFM